MPFTASTTPTRARSIALGLNTPTPITATLPSVKIIVNTIANHEPALSVFAAGGGGGTLGNADIDIGARLSITPGTRKSRRDVGASTGWIGVGELSSAGGTARFAAGIAGTV